MKEYGITDGISLNEPEEAEALRRQLSKSAADWISLQVSENRITGERAARVISEVYDFAEKINGHSAFLKDRPLMYREVGALAKELFDAAASIEEITSKRRDDLEQKWRAEHERRGQPQ